MTNHRLAAGLMIGQGILFATETAMVHVIGPRLSVVQLTLLRSFAGLVVVAMLAWHGRGVGWWIVKTDRFPLYLTRGFVSLGYLWVLMFSFSHLPFADATAISYTQAAYVAIFSAFVLRERVGSLRWAAVIVGFLGALLIIRPAFVDWNFAYLVALFGTSLNGLAFVLNKYLQRPEQDSDLTTMFYVNAIPFLFNLPLCLTAPLPALDVLPWLSGIVLFGPVGFYLGIVAVRYANASALGPYTFLRLVIGLVAGVVVFREVPGLLGLLGAALILVSCVLSIVDPAIGAGLRQRIGSGVRWFVTAMPLPPLRRGLGGTDAQRSTIEAQASWGDR